VRSLSKKRPQPLGNNRGAFQKGELPYLSIFKIILHNITWNSSADATPPCPAKLSFKEN